MAEPAIGYGTTLEVSSDGGITWTAIAKLTSIGEVSIEADDVDVTAYDSPNGFREYIRGLADAGELEFTGVWIADTTQTQVVNDLLGGPGGALKDYRITLPGNLGTFECRGYVKGWSLNPQLEDRIEFSGTLKLSGAPTMTVA